MKIALKSFAFGSAILGGVLALSACGDDVTKVYQTTENNSGMEVAESADDFDKCDSALIGKMMFASDENAAYICADSGWTPLSKKVSDGKDGTSCSAELLKNGSGYKIVCGEDSVGVIRNGKEGAKGSKGEAGEAGAAGENGTSCSVELLSDSSGYKVICGGDSVGVISNGSDGEGCTLMDNGDGTIKQVCASDTVTLYKAFCGTVAYDPEKSFCLEDSAYSCNGKPYDPTVNICHSGNVFDTMTDSRDNQTYRIVNIGAQTWMAENLNYAYTEKTSSLDSSSFCYNNDPANCEIYGRLYIWSAAMDSVARYSENGKNCGLYVTCSAAETVRGVCPEGWHLPSLDEWNTLVAYIETQTSDSIGYVLKSTSGWDWESDTGESFSGNGSDAFLFEALPAGNRHGAGASYNLHRYASFWTSSESEDSYAWSTILDVKDNDLMKIEDAKGVGYSVRCVKNSTEE